MDDDHWNPARLPLTVFNCPITAAQSEQRKRESAVSERVAIQRAYDQSDPETAKRLVKRLSQQLIDQIPLSAYASEFLGEALALIADDPTCTASSLGLVAPKGRPPVDDNKLIEAMLLVRKYQSDRVPLKDGKRGDGAYSKAAKETRISASIIIREWSDWKHRLNPSDDENSD